MSRAQPASDYSSGSNYGMKNRIINGGMDIWQRGTSFTSIASDTYSLDRWRTTSYSTSALFDITKSSDVPPSNEFQNSQRLTVTTADSLVAAGEFMGLTQVIEGYNVRDLIGRTFTLSFWVRSTKTGIHCIAFRNSGADRSYVAEYTIITSNTWEYKSITVSGGLITAGDWDWTNGKGLHVAFILVASTTFQTTAGSWVNGNYPTTSNQVNCLDTKDNIFAITGVQLEAGAVATPFEHRPYGMELALCQRYYARINAATLYSSFGTGVVSSTTLAAGVNVKLPVTMRTAPSMGFSNVRIYDGNATPAVTSFNNTFNSPDFWAGDLNCSGGGLTVGRAATLNANNNAAAYIDASAEL